MLYFAYGSNMDWRQMRDRCPSARFVCVAELRDHRLAFTRRSESRKCGVADAVAAKGERVWGVVYQIDDYEIGRLDKAEGFQPGRASNAYVRQDRHVYEDGDREKPVLVSIYFAQPDTEAETPLPNCDYKELIVGGARYWHLPDDYIAVLDKIEVAQ